MRKKWRTRWKREAAWVCIRCRPCWRNTAGYPPRPQSRELDSIDVQLVSRISPATTARQSHLPTPLIFVPLFHRHVRTYLPPSLSLSLQFFSFVIVRYNGQVNNAPKIRWRVKATFVERSVEMVVSKVVNMFRKCDIERTSISCIEIFGSILISYLEKYFPARLFLRLGITGVTISPLLNRSVFRKDFASAGHEPMTVRFITYCIECRSYNTVIM